MVGRKKQHTLWILLSVLLGAHFSAFGQDEVVSKLMFRDKAPQGVTTSRGHSHNDYERDIPLLRALYAGMGSIEADVFVRDGELLVAHTAEELDRQRTLSSLYLDPLFALAQSPKPLPSSVQLPLQLMVDIKGNHREALRILQQQLSERESLVDPNSPSQLLQIVISGDRPKPEDFVRYPTWIQFDGSPGVDYSAEAWSRIAMVSDDLKAYTHWNGKGVPVPEDLTKIRRAIEAAHEHGKPFRFWGNHDSPNTWQQLYKWGVDWINTDQPEELSRFLESNAREEFRSEQVWETYRPTYASDDKDIEIRRVIYLIGDGMGPAQVKAALSANRGRLNMTQMHAVGMSRTEAANSDNTDSAAGGTALATGRKTNNRMIATDPSGQSLPSIAGLLADRGWGTAVLTTGDITDATPAVFYASVVERDSSRAIAQQALSSKVSILGGGAPSWMKGSAMATYDSLCVQQGIHLTDSLHLRQSAERQFMFLPSDLTKPYKEGRGDVLGRLLEGSLSVLGEQYDRFFVMAEAAQIDFGGHANDLPYVVTETLDFDQAVGAALRYADQDGHTLVIVTADHETGGLTLLDSDERNGYVRGHFSTNDHTNLPVPVFAYGPKSSAFSGYYQNVAIFQRLLEVLGAASSQ